MTLSSAYIELFIRGEKSWGKCPGEMSGYPNEDCHVKEQFI